MVSGEKYDAGSLQYMVEGTLITWFTDLIIWTENMGAKSVVASSGY